MRLSKSVICFSNCSIAACLVSICFSKFLLFIYWTIFREAEPIINAAIIAMADTLINLWILKYFFTHPVYCFVWISIIEPQHLQYFVLAFFLFWFSHDRVWQRSCLFNNLNKNTFITLPTGDNSDSEILQFPVERYSTSWLHIISSDIRSLSE